MREGRVFKRGKSWAYVVDISPPGAARKQRTKSGFATKSQALRRCTRSRSRSSSAGTSRRAALTLGDLPDHAVAAGRALLGAAEHLDRVRGLHPAVRRAAHRRPAAAVDHAAASCGSSTASSRRTGRVRGSGGLSSKTVHNVHITLLKALGDAQEDQLVVRNPAVRAHRTSVDDRAGQHLVRRPGPHVPAATSRGPAVRPVAPGRHHRHAPRRAARAALARHRPHCRAGRRRADATQGQRHHLLLRPKTQRSRRTIAIDAVTIEVLKRHRRRRPASASRSAPRTRTTSCVFCFADGKPLDPDGVGQRFQRHAREAGLPVIRLPRPPAHPRHAGADGRRPPQGDAGAARPLLRRLHARHLQPRHPDHAGGGREQGRRPTGQARLKG